MISARILQQKTLAEAEGVTADEMAKAEKTLKSYDIAIRESGGGLRNLDSILLELSKSWTTMSDSEKQYVANTMAGVRQSSSFVAIMESMTRQQELYGEAMNNTNALYDAQQKYANSLEGKLGSLSATYEVLMTRILTSSTALKSVEFATGMVEGITKVIDTFGLFPSAITAVVGGMTLFNKKFNEVSKSLVSFVKPIRNVLASLDSMSSKFSNQIKSYKQQITHLDDLSKQYQKAGLSTTGLTNSMSSLNNKIAFTNVKLVATKVATVALTSALSMGLTLGITTAINAMSKLIDRVVVTNKELDEMNKTFMESNGDMTSKITEVDQLIKKYEALSRVKANPDSSSEQLTKADSELLEIQKKLAEVYPQVADAIGEDGEVKSINLDITKQMLSVEKQKQQADAQSIISNNKQLDSLKKLTQFGDTYKKNLEESTEASEQLAKGVTEVTKEFVYMNGDVRKTANYTEDLANKQEKLTKKISDSQTILMGQREAYITLANGSTLYKEEIALLDEILSYATDSSEELGNSTQGLSDDFVAMADDVESVTKKIEGLSDAYSGTNDTIKFLQGVIDEYTEKGKLGEETTESILSKYTDLIPLLYEETDVIALANEHLGVQSQLREDTKNQAIQAYREEQEAMVSNENERIRLEQEEIRVREEKIAQVQALEEEKKNSMTRVSEHNINANLVEEDRKLVDSMAYEEKRRQMVEESKARRNTIYAEESEAYKGELLNREAEENASLGRSQKIRADQARNMSTIYAEGSDNEKSAFLQAEAEKRRVESENNLLRSQENSKRMRDQSTMYTEDSKKANVEANKKLQDEKTALDKVKEANEIANRNKSTIYAEDTNNYKTELDNKLSATKTYVDSINEAISKIKDKTVTVTTENVVKNSSTGASSSTSRPNATPQSIDMQGLSQMRSALVSDLSDTYTSKQQAYAEANKIIQQRTATPTSYSTGGTKSVKVGENNINIVLSNIGGSNANNINVETNKILERMLGELQNARSINFNIDKINAIDQGSKEATAHSVSYVLGSYIRK